MVDIGDYSVGLPGKRPTDFSPEDLIGWTARQPSAQARRWSMLNGLVHGLVWAFPFVMLALVWRRVSGADGNTFWPALFFAIGMLLLLIFLLKGILSPRTWWFAYTGNEVILEHGLVIKARDHVAFDRVQYLERRAGPIMRSLGISSLFFETAAGRASIPAAQLNDIETIEASVRAAMQRASIV